MHDAHENVHAQGTHMRHTNNIHTICKQNTRYATYGTCFDVYKVQINKILEKVCTQGLFYVLDTMGLVYLPFCVYCVCVPDPSALWYAMYIMLHLVCVPLLCTLCGCLVCVPCVSLRNT